MSNTSNASKNVRRFLLLFALGVAYGFMYVMPYMKSSFYDQMIAAMGCTNAQLGSLMTYYTIALTISYLPGGWIGDKFSPKPVLLLSIFGQAALSFLFMFTYQSYIPVSASGRLRRGHGSARTQRRMPAGVRRFLRLTAPGKHSKIKDGGSVPPGNEKEIRLRRCFLWNLQKYIFPICARTRSARSKSCAGS